MREFQFVIVHNSKMEVAVNIANVSHFKNYGEGGIIHFIGTEKKVYTDENLQKLLEIIGKNK